MCCENRRRRPDALVRGDMARIADGYARLAAELVRARRIHDAIHELEEGIDVVTRGHGPHAPDAPAALVETLAALRA